MDERLIQLVRKYEELFDVTHKKYTDTLHKDTIWRAIGEEMNRTGYDCKVRWSSLRDQYRRYLRKMHTKSGQAANNKWRYAEEMSFIKPFLRDRDSVANLEEEMANPVVTIEETDSMLALPATKREVDPALSEEEVPPRRAVGPTRKRSRTLARKCVHAAEAPSYVLMRHFLESERVRGGSPDAIDLFFQSISASVKKLSPYHQTMCKTRVLAVVAELEMKELSEQSSLPCDKL